MTCRRILTAILPAVLLAAAACGANSTPQDGFSEACAAFDKGDFRSAQYLGESLVNQGHFAPELFQLLGNTRYRQGDLGRAALYYQRAALLSPPSPETRQNIDLIHERTGNYYFPTNTLRDRFAAWFTRSQWLAAAAAFGWLLTFSAGFAFLVLGAGRPRKVLLMAAVVALTGGTVSLLGWFWHPSFEKVRDLAVVTSPETRAYAAASTTGSSLAQLPAGSQVRKLEDRDSWCYVEFHNENPQPEGRNIRGWVQTESISPLWPYDSAFLE